MANLGNSHFTISSQAGPSLPSSQQHIKVLIFLPGFLFLGLSIFGPGRAWRLGRPMNYQGEQMLQGTASWMEDIRLHLLYEKRRQARASQVSSVLAAV
jgi:hypothetical protein